MENLKIKNTALDRRIKVSPTLARVMQLLKSEKSWTYQEIADQFGLSAPAVRYHCLDAAKKQEFKEKSAKRKAEWWRNTSQIKRQEFSRKWAQSCKDYKEALIETKFENVNW